MDSLAPSIRQLLFPHPVKSQDLRTWDRVLYDLMTLNGRDILGQRPFIEQLQSQLREQICAL